jgi:hypothetical protein
VAVSAVVVAAAGISRAQTALPTVNVRNYGATGNGSTNDTAAIQKANDAVVAQGGGTVYFPAGTYRAMGVLQDSNVTFQGSPGAVLKHYNGTTNSPIVAGRVIHTTGSIVEGSQKLRVAVARGFVPGAVVAVRAAGGASKVQATKTAWPLANRIGSVVFANEKYWPRTGQNFALIENEIISYTGMRGATAQNVHRGLFGTAAVAHMSGAPIAQLQVLYAHVVSVSGLDIQLDKPAVQGVRGSRVDVGVVDATVRDLTLDGNKVAGGSSSTNPVPLSYSLANGVTITNNTIQRGDHGAIILDEATTGAVVQNNTMLDNGTPSAHLGSAVWLFRGATGNVVQDNTIGGDSYNGITIDDRSESSNEFDAPADNNAILRNHIELANIQGNAAIYVVGSDLNEVGDNDVRSSYYGVAVSRSTQGLYPANAGETLVRDNLLQGHFTGMYVSGSYNRFERNTITDCEQAVSDEGVGNQFA